MKQSILILSLLINTFMGLGQVPKSIVKKFQTLIEFIKENNAIELSKFVEYPIERGYPIPTIKNNDVLPIFGLVNSRRIRLLVN